MTGKSDSELVHLTLAGDGDSFSELCRRYYCAMVAIADSILSDRHLAEDAAQQRPGGKLQAPSGRQTPSIPQVGRPLIEPDELGRKVLKVGLKMTDQQWLVIKPKLELIQSLLDQSIGWASVQLDIKEDTNGKTTTQTLRFRDFMTPSERDKKIPGYRSLVEDIDLQEIAGASTPGTQNGRKVTWTWGVPRRISGDPTACEKSCIELSELLADENVNPQQIKAKMDTLRSAREQARKELAKARQELREVLTIQQQAKMLLLGYLD